MNVKFNERCVDEFMNLLTQFNSFWQAYPRKVAKLAAQRAWIKAMKSATFEEIMSGVERYKANKPDQIDWCHPATFLSQGRWMDEYDEEKSAPKLSPSAEFMKNKTALDRAEARIKDIRNQMPLPENDRRRAELATLKVERVRLMGLLEFKA